MTNSDTAVSVARRVVGLALAVCLVLGFSVVVIAAGHGGAPIGMLMVLGSLNAWGSPMALGWIAIVLFAVSFLVRSRAAHLATGATGAGLLTASWLYFASETKALDLMLVTSIPFGVMMVAYGLYLLYGLARRGGRIV